MKIIKNCLFIFLLTLVISCKKDKNEITDVKFDFTLISELESNAGLNYLMATDSNGTVLFDTMGSSINEYILIPNIGQQQIDITHAYEKDDFFNIKTFRSVSSGFRILSSEVVCDGELNQAPLEFYKASVKINDIVPFQKATYPFQNKENISYDWSNNSITLIGDLEKGNDIVITIHINDTEGYKSLWIKSEDWNIDSDTIYFETSLNNFAETKINEIQLTNKNFSWRINSTAIINDGRKISLAYKEAQGGKSISLYTSNDIEIQKIKLEINTPNPMSGLRYQGILNYLPPDLYLYESGVGFLAGEQSNSIFNIKPTSNHSFAKISYQYRNGNNRYYWDIYQLNGVDTYYKLPRLANDFIQNAPLIASNLNTAKEIIVSDYKIDNSGFKDNYEESNVDNFLKCLNFRGISVYLDL